MSGTCRRSVGILASALIALGCPGVKAQSNALGAEGGAVSELIAAGVTPWSPGAVEAFLTEGGFRVTRREAKPDGSEAALLVAAPNGMPFVFLFTNCAAQGCLFVEAIQPLNPKGIGVTLTGRDVNDFNRANPLQVFLTSEAEGGVAVRWATPALAGCDADCQRSAMNMYFVSSLSFLEALAKASKRVLVEAPFEESPRPGVAAALAAGPKALPQEAWATASLAFGEGDLRALLGAQADLAERLSEGLEELSVTPVGATEAFPSLLPR